MWDRNRRNMLGTVDDMPQYRKYMTQALELAHKGAGWVNPNPLVGTEGCLRSRRIVVPILRRPGRGPSLALEDGDDIAVGAALGVACGLVFWLFNFAYA